MTPWTVAHQASLSIAFARQEYCSGLPFPCPGDLANPGVKSTSPASSDSFSENDLFGIVSSKSSGISVRVVSVEQCRSKLKNSQLKIVY